MWTIIMGFQLHYYIMGANFFFSPWPLEDRKTQMQFRTSDRLQDLVLREASLVADAFE